MYALFRARQLLAAAPALFVLLLVVLGTHPEPFKIKPIYDDAAVELALVAPEPETLPEPKVAQEVPPPVIEDEETTLAPPPPKPQPKPDPKSKPKPAPKPVREKPAPVLEAITKKTVQPVVTQAAAVPTPPQPKVDNQALENGYLNGLRGELNGYKQYPTGRQASLERPNGKVVIWLLVNRQGQVLDSGLQTRASNMLLNRAATNSLRRIKQVKPFPPQAFAGRDEHRFTATFNYSVQ